MYKTDQYNKARGLFIDKGYTALAAATEAGVHEKQVRRWIKKYNWKALQSDKRMERQLIILGMGVSRAEVVEDFKAYLSDHYPEIAQQIINPSEQYLKQFKSTPK
ncbi:helix-turn-helix domain-containing protein [Mucilaginibacter sp.]|uniref:terminase gpP N-terminus-related DNA-binding protein n=1 Tax=Mucilaginibacter sp. TaxID=1882438 RepID=UPI0025D1FB8F|nr:helix-turn-helix domain-containing protein [Mucilaginibacter sp.]